MKYLHPDVLDNGPALIRSAATRALLLPDFDDGMTYSEVVASALATAVISSADFTFSDEGAGRKLVFGGKTAQATAGTASSSTLHVAYTDGASRILWVDPIRTSSVLAGQNYKIPAQTLNSPQPT